MSEIKKEAPKKTVSKATPKKPLDNLISIMDSRVDNQGYSLKELYDEVISMQGSRDGALIFSEFIKRRKDAGDTKIMDEFNKTAFVEDITNLKKPTPKKEVKAPKDSWKEKLAMLKGKKGYKGKIAKEKKAVSGTKSRSIKRDLEKRALPKGKRISKNGKVYYESRPNRSDIDPKEKFEKGGEIKNNGWGINTSW